MKSCEQKIEGFLIEYGGQIVSLSKGYPEGSELDFVRFHKLEGIRRKGIKEIKGLIAEFGER